MIRRHGCLPRGKPVSPRKLSYRRSPNGNPIAPGLQTQVLQVTIAGLLIVEQVDRDGTLDLVLLGAEVVERTAVDIEPFRRFRWTADKLRLLGTEYDHVLAARWGLCTRSVAIQRKRRGLRVKFLALPGSILE